MILRNNTVDFIQKGWLMLTFC